MRPPHRPCIVSCIYPSCTRQPWKLARSIMSIMSCMIHDGDQEEEKRGKSLHWMLRKRRNQWQGTHRTTSCDYSKAAATWSVCCMFYRLNTIGKLCDLYGWGGREVSQSDVMRVLLLVLWPRDSKIGSKLLRFLRAASDSDVLFHVRYDGDGTSNSKYKCKTCTLYLIACIYLLRRSFAFWTDLSRN